MRERIRFALWGIWCRIFGHAQRVEGDWPEDRVCPRCNDTEMDIGLSVTIVHGKGDVPISDQRESWERGDDGAW